MLFNSHQLGGGRHRLPFSGLEEDGNTWKARTHTKNHRSFRKLNTKSSCRAVDYFCVLSDREEDNVEKPEGTSGEVSYLHHGQLCIQLNHV